MKKKYSILVLAAAFLFPCYLQAQSQEDVFRQEGIASWYGKEFDGRPTASGEIYDSSQLTAAHPNLPFGTMLVVTNRHNDKKVTVRVNDRGPFVAARIIDVSRAAAEQLDMIITGTAPVLIESVAAFPAGNVPEVNRVPETRPSEPADNRVPDPMPPETQITYAPVTAAPSAPVTAAPDTSRVQQPVPQAASQIRLMPDITIVNDKIYRLQIGSFTVARNAVETFERLKDAGLNPNYERFTNDNNVEYFRVVLAGIRGSDIQAITVRLRDAGFREVLIREEN